MLRYLIVPRPNDRCTSGEENQIALREKRTDGAARREEEEKIGEMRRERKGNAKRAERNVNGAEKGQKKKTREREKEIYRAARLAGELHGFRKRWGV